MTTLSPMYFAAQPTSFKPSFAGEETDEPGQPTIYPSGDDAQIPATDAEPSAGEGKKPGEGKRGGLLVPLLALGGLGAFVLAFIAMGIAIIFGAKEGAECIKINQ